MSRTNLIISLGIIVFIFVIPLLLSADALAVACFPSSETNKIFVNLRDKWWTQEDQLKMDINLHAAHLIEREGGLECILLIESRMKKNTCHACAANLGIAVYSKSVETWVSTFEQKNNILLGEWGKVPETTIVKIGEDNYGIFVHNRNLAQGYASESYTLLAKIDDEYVKLINIPTHSDNYGTGIAGLFEWNATIEFVEDRDKKFFDIKIVKKGTQGSWENGKMKLASVNEIRLYKFGGGKYLLFKDNDIP